MNREDVRPSKVEDQKHIDRPPTHPFDARQSFYDFGIRQTVTLLQRRDIPVQRFLGEASNIGRLGSGESSGSQPINIGCDYVAWIRELAHIKEGLEPAQDRTCRMPAQLLMDYRMDE
jgi:hypothetical protein